VNAYLHVQTTFAHIWTLHPNAKYSSCSLVVKELGSAIKKHRSQHKSNIESKRDLTKPTMSNQSKSLLLKNGTALIHGENDKVHLQAAKSSTAQTRSSPPASSTHTITFGNLSSKDAMPTKH
jgi:hypothetical protein